MSLSTRRPGAAIASRSLLVGLGAVGAVVAAREVPIAVPCPIHAATGLYCPGCGVSRAVSAVADGDFALAVRQHPLLPIVAALVMWFAARWVVGPALRFEVSDLTRRRGLIATVTVVVAFGVLRNIPQLRVLQPL